MAQNNKYKVTYTQKITDNNSAEYGYAIEKSVKFKSFDAARKFLRGLVLVNLIGKPIFEGVKQ